MYLDYKNLDFDKDGLPEQPELILKTMADDTLGVIPGVSKLKLNIKFSEPSTIKFDVAAKLEDGKDNWIYDRLSGYKVVYTEKYGIYLITGMTMEEDGISNVKHIEGSSLEYMLNTKKFFIEEGTFKFCDLTDPTNEDTVIGRILEAAPGWSINYVSPALAQKYRTFEQYDDFLLSFMYGDAKDKFRCIFVFDPYERTISAYDADEETSPLPIYLDFDNLIEEVEVEELTDELVTAIRPYGADELNIIDVNPIGSNWIYDLSYFIENGDIPTELANKWMSWQNLILSNRELYRSLVTLQNSSTSRLLAAQAALTELKGELETLQAQQSVIIQALAMETTKVGKRNQQEKLDSINILIASKEERIADQEELVASIQRELSADSFSSLVVNIDPVQAGTGDPSPTNIRAISGRTEANITRTGRNLCPPFTIGSYYNLDTGVIRSDDASAITSLFRIDFSEGALTLAYDVSLRAMLYAWDADGNYVGRTVGGPKQVRVIVPTDFTAGSGGTHDYASIAFVAVRLYVGTDSTDTINTVVTAHIQLEYGSEATDYEPYQNETKTISFDRTVYEGQFDVATGELTVTHEIATFDGSENWGGPDEYGNFYLSLSNANKMTDRKTGGLYSELLFNILKHGGTDVGAGFISSGGYLDCKPTGISTVADWKTFLGTTNLQVVYPLATPVIYCLTPVEIAALINGKNNIWADCGEVRAETSYVNKIRTLVNSLSFANNFTAAEREILSKYFIEQDITEDTFVASTLESSPSGSYYPLTGTTVIDINPVQDGSGDPSPTNIRTIRGWIGANTTATAGKNLVPISNITEGNHTYYGVPCNLTDGVITLNGTASSTADIVFAYTNTSPYLLDRSGSYILSGGTSSQSVALRIKKSGASNRYIYANDKDVAFTLSDGEYVDRYYTPVTSGKSYSATLYPMIRTSGTSADFEKFTSTDILWSTQSRNMIIDNKPYPEEHNGVTITRSEDGSYTLNGTKPSGAQVILFNFGKDDDSTGNTQFDYKKWLLTGDYKMSLAAENMPADAKVRMQVYSYDYPGAAANMVLIGDVDSNASVRYFSVTSSQKYVMARLMVPTTDAVTFENTKIYPMIQRADDTNDTWAPSSATTTDLVYKGTLDLSAGSLTVTHKAVDMGSLTWIYTSSYGQPFFYTDISDGQHQPTGAHDVEFWCSSYKALPQTMNATTMGSDAANYDIVINQRGNSYPLRIFCRDDSYGADAAAFKAAVAGQTIVYPLETPLITYRLSPVQIDSLANSNINTTNCRSDAGEIHSVPAAIDISNSAITKIDSTDSFNKTLYSFNGGAFAIEQNAGFNVTGEVIRGTLEINNSRAFVLSLYGGRITNGSATAQSGTLIVSGELANLISDVTATTIDEVTTNEGTELSFDVDSGTLYLTANVGDYQKYSVQTELYDFAVSTLSDLATPTYEFSVDSGNFIFSQEFEPFRDELKLGRGIYLNLGHDHVITPNIIEFELDFEDYSKFSMVFSNRFKRYDQVNTLKDMVEKSYSYSRSFDASKHIYNQSVSQSSAVSKYMQDALDSAVNTIIGASNQSVIINGAGIHVSGPVASGDDASAVEDFQLRIVNGMIAMTKDNWATADLAIGAFKTDSGYHFGVNAEVIGGNLIVGNELIIEAPQVDQQGQPTGVMQFKVDGGGAWLNNSTFVLQSDANNGGKIIIDPRWGILAGTKDLFDIGEDGASVSPGFLENEEVAIIDYDTWYGTPMFTNFYLDIKTGNAYFRGTVFAGAGEIGGWTLADDYFYSGSGSTYVALNASGSNNNSTYAIWAGAATPGSAPFSVTKAGKLKATNIEVTGGTISIGSNNNTKFSVDNAGNVTANSFSGKLNGTLSAGSNGGWLEGCGIRVGANSSAANGYNFYVDTSGNVSISGNLTLGSGVISWSSLDSGVQSTINTASDNASSAYSLADDAADDVYDLARGQYTSAGTTFISGKTIYSPTISAGSLSAVSGTFTGELLNTSVAIVNPAKGTNFGTLSYNNGGLDINSMGGLRLYGTFNETFSNVPGNIWMQATGSSSYTSFCLYSPSAGSNASTAVFNCAVKGLSWTDTSDIRLKNTINYDLTKYEEITKNLKPCSFKFNNEPNKVHFGFIAQDVKANFEDHSFDSEEYGVLSVFENEEEEMIYGLAYDEFIALQQWQIQKLESRIEVLESLIKV